MLNAVQYSSGQEFRHESRCPAQSGPFPPGRLRFSTSLTCSPMCMYSHTCAQWGSKAFIRSTCRGLWKPWKSWAMSNWCQRSQHCLCTPLLRTISNLACRLSLTVSVNRHCQRHPAIDAGRESQAGMLSASPGPVLGCKGAHSALP